ncbi:aminotransferase class V-fold PLP-dependent enzyme [Paraburkholderia sp. 1N]|uniref:Aminotransferase class V-fold PLP-dependent enzyme n=1 Tax=Paraburkholderia solitsugae TaxID=2675748 RepID=A0ABX2BU24_9BURK|nr:DegT/DnrJ/EryC1/StrS family aminotransferase [Paraburkholderia solitsugae]NPT43483.1 aminotransferase class V-fold PLP-dependent enzyme [Paraburkholderia solitsugae]
MKELALNGGPKAIAGALPTFRNASGRSLGAEEIEQLTEVINSGSLSFLSGEKTKEFERNFAELFGAKQAVSVSSGTAALHTAVTYLNPEPGDEIIVTPITDMGSIIPVLAQLAIPVFVDVDPETQNMDPAKLEAAITPRTKAIIVTHIYGNPADMDAIMAVAKRHNLFVIEDCAQAHLATYKGHLCGTLGHLGCFSFQQSKHMTTGDGGMVIANEDERFGRELRQCSDKGWPRSKGGRDHQFLAPNYHMTELQAAVGIAQLRKLEGMVEARRQSAFYLSELLTGSGANPTKILPDTKGTFFFYTFRVDPSKLTVPTSDFVKALVAEGIDCFLGYPGRIPIYRYPVVKDALTFGTSGFPFTLPNARKGEDYSQPICPVAEKACVETVCIWWNERFGREHVEQIGSAIRKVMDAYRA